MDKLQSQHVELLYDNKHNIKLKQHFCNVCLRPCCNQSWFFILCAMKLWFWINNLLNLCI